jgi:hypothetical protein
MRGAATCASAIRRPTEPSTCPPTASVLSRNGVRALTLGLAPRPEESATSTRPMQSNVATLSAVRVSTAATLSRTPVWSWEGGAASRARTVWFSRETREKPQRTQRTQRRRERKKGSGSRIWNPSSSQASVLSVSSVVKHPEISLERGYSHSFALGAVYMNLGSSLTSTRATCAFSISGTKFAGRTVTKTALLSVELPAPSTTS